MAPAEVGHRATVVCHLMNICRELGRKLHWDPVKEEFLGDDEANKLRSRPRREGDTNCRKSGSLIAKLIVHRCRLAGVLERRVCGQKLFGNAAFKHAG